VVVDPETVASVMRPLGVWWGFAGGWAIDLWIGQVTRRHHDVEVVVRREDQLRIHQALSREWQMMCLEPPHSAWRPWREQERISAPAFQTKARQRSTEFDLFLEDVVGGVWSFRRDRSIQRPVEDVLADATSELLPVVRPEIQLLYMAKSGEPKNQHDFERVLPQLGREGANWLRHALLVIDPEHRWVARLDTP
jgi:hypothetical protein